MPDVCCVEFMLSDSTDGFCLCRPFSQSTGFREGLPSGLRLHHLPPQGIGRHDETPVVALFSRTVQEDETRGTRVGSNPALTPGKGIRAQRLKDLLLEKELRNDISTAEFALRLDVPRVESEAVDAKVSKSGVGEGRKTPYTPKLKPRGVIDYEKIAEKLEKSLELIDRRQERLSAAVSRDSRLSGNSEGDPASGTHFVGEEAALRVTRRLSETRTELQNVLFRVRASMASAANDGGGKFTSGGGGGSSSSSKGGNSSSAFVGAASGTAAAGGVPGGEESERSLNPLTVFVREDGTVDWDGAFQSGKELAKYSGEVLERLQGKSPGEEAPPAKASTSLATIDSSPGMQLLQRYLQELESELRAAEDERDK